MKETRGILGYFISPNLHEVLDVNAHNWKEQGVIKHPRKDQWAVAIIPGNPYINMRGEGKVVASLPEDWFV